MEPICTETVESTVNWSLDHVFVDWLTIRQPNDGRYPALNDGGIMRIDSDGEVDWQHPVAVEHVGSHDSKARIKVKEDVLELSFNPSRWNRPDNLFGHSYESAVAVADSLLAGMGLPALQKTGRDMFTLSRVDMTLNVCCGSKGKADAYLRHMARQTMPRKRTGTAKSTVYYSSSMARYKIYNKGEEIRANKGPEKLAEYCLENGIVRVEFKLQREFLKSRNIRKADKITHEKLVEEFGREVEKMSTECMEFDAEMLTKMELLHLLAWQRGFRPRELCSLKTFYKHRKAIREKTGFDIGAEPPLRFEPKTLVFRTVAAVPPDWYEMPETPVVNRLKAVES